MSTLYHVSSTPGATKGAVVQSSGVDVEGKITIVPWNGSAAPLGFVYATIAAAGEGYVLGNGRVSGIDTSGTSYSETWVANDVIYGTISGELTNVKPSDPVFYVVGKVVSVHASTGVLLVNISSGGLPSATDGDMMIYAGGLWTLFPRPVGAGTFVHGFQSDNHVWLATDACE